LTGCDVNPTPPEEIIIDNRDRGCGIVTGVWDTSDATDGNGCWGPDFLYHFADRTQPAAVRFYPEITKPGRYIVFIYWSAHANRTQDQPVVVRDAEGKTTYHVNLQENGNRWFELGRHNFDTQTKSYIEFNTYTDDGYCNADAIRLLSDF
jgi:hypothetical protein